MPQMPPPSHHPGRFLLFSRDLELPDAFFFFFNGASKCASTSSDKSNVIQRLTLSLPRPKQTGNLLTWFVFVWMFGLGFCCPLVARHRSHSGQFEERRFEGAAWLCVGSWASCLIRLGADEGPREQGKKKVAQNGTARPLCRGHSSSQHPLIALSHASTPPSQRTLPSQATRVPLSHHLLLPPRPITHGHKPML